MTPKKLLTYTLVAVTVFSSHLEAAKKHKQPVVQETATACVICLDDITEENPAASKYWHCDNIDHSTSTHVTCANQIILGPAPTCPLCRSAYKLRNYQRIHKEQRERLKLRKELGQAFFINLDGRKIRKLLDAGITMNTPDEKGNTLLHSAASIGLLVFLETLLHFDVEESINKPNERGLTPLHYAVYKKNHKAIKMLLDNGARTSISIQDKRGKTPLDYALESDAPKVIDLLLTHNNR